MNFNEALQVLRRINVHHGNAPISDAQAQCFYEELARSVSFDEANAAVREFYALHPHGEWMTVGDINLAVRRPDVYLEVQHPCWSCNSNSSSANASAGVR